MVKYRLKFKFEKGEVSDNREDNINVIMSEIDSIESDTPIRKPENGETVEISGSEYNVESVVISFEKEGDMTYYDFIILLSRKENEVDRIKRMVENQLRNQTKYLQYKEKYLI